MKLYFLSKTTNLLDGRTWHFVHESSDLFYGTEHATDPYVGDNAALREDLKKYGRHCFRVIALQAFPIREQAEQALERYKPQSTYVVAPRIYTEEYRELQRQLNLGENNPFYGKHHTEDTRKSLSEYRKTMRWAHNGDLEQQFPASDALPDGWTYGRSAAQRERMRVVRNNTIEKKKKQQENPE